MIKTETGSFNACSCNQQKCMCFFYSVCLSVCLSVVILFLPTIPTLYSLLLLITTSIVSFQSMEYMWHYVRGH